MKNYLFLKPLVFVAFLSSALTLSAADYDFVVDRLAYTITSGTTVEVACPESGEEYAPGADYSGVINIPRTVIYDGTTYTVTGIGLNAFAFSPVTQVIIPNTVTYIDTQAFFECWHLTSVSFGSGTNTIGDFAFNLCEDLKYVTCRATTPPTIYEFTFKIMNGSGYGLDHTNLYVPSSSLNAYRSKTYWKEFGNITSIPSLKEALSSSSSPIQFTSTGSYPWMTMVADGRIYAMSGNSGVHSSSSTLSATVNVAAGGTLSFDFKAWGEGTSYDKCIFSVDGSQKFSFGDRDNNWERYSVNLSAGTHTLTWTYSKDYSVNPTGDFFAIDNVSLVESVKLGDVDGNGSVGISDVTVLIDILLNGGTAPVSADCDQDGQVGISDVTALIDGLLNGTLNPSNPHYTGCWMVIYDKDGIDYWYPLTMSPDNSYITVVSLYTYIFGSSTTQLYFVDNSYTFGAPGANQSLVIGNSSSNPLVPSQNCYTITTGYSYTLGITYDSNNNRCVYVSRGGACG